jgi:hypothetical protein
MVTLRYMWGVRRRYKIYIRLHIHNHRRSYIVEKLKTSYHYIVDNIWKVYCML